ncbi:hypothetical protein R3X46_25135, partial [Salmonella enterica subsp. enterica serovar Agona]|uniref:hypothetical protein n=1 Tax=Salmonella enterica TaxID=28901 RepID=UPI002A75A545
NFFSRRTDIGLPKYMLNKIGSEPFRSEDTVDANMNFFSRRTDIGLPKYMLNKIGSEPFRSEDTVDAN